jgi:hypothetical protein
MWPRSWETWAGCHLFPAHHLWFFLGSQRAFCRCYMFPTSPEQREGLAQRPEIFLLLLSHR